MPKKTTRLQDIEEEVAAWREKQAFWDRCRIERDLTSGVVRTTKGKLDKRARDLTKRNAERYP